jgi:hypothetical protein
MYLSVYVPHLQTVGAVVGYLHTHKGQRFASTATVVPMTDAFVRNIEHFVEREGVDMVAFDWKQRKDDVTRARLLLERCTLTALWLDSRFPAWKLARPIDRLAEW